MADPIRSSLPPQISVPLMWKGKSFRRICPRSELQSTGSGKQGPPGCRPRRREGTARVAFGLVGVVAVALAALIDKRFGVSCDQRYLSVQHTIMDGSNRGASLPEARKQDAERREEPEHGMMMEGRWRLLWLATVVWCSAPSSLGTVEQGRSEHHITQHHL